MTPDSSAPDGRFTPKPGKPAPTKGMAAATATRFSINDAMGGPRGLLEGVLPSFLFTIIFTATRDLKTALAAAIGVAAVSLVARLFSRSTVMPGLMGLAGVLFSAYMANRTGDARSFFLPGLWINAGYGLVFLLSTVKTPAIPAIGLKKGPWPILGLALGTVTGEMLSWRHNPARARAFRLATLTFAGLFIARLAVQLPLYVLDEVFWLGTARLIMSTPLFIACGWVTFLLLRDAPIASPIDEDSDTATGQVISGDGLVTETRDDDPPPTR